jgi:predicted ATP-dependent endonuclease of OLD family
MQLHSVSIVGLHDALTLEVEFNEEITLLVGINGSGKTSVLNVIDWLLKPDLQKLATTVYKRLSLSFTDKNAKYSITATKTDTWAPRKLADFSGLGLHEKNAFRHLHS